MYITVQIVQCRAGFGTANFMQTFRAKVRTTVVICCNEMLVGISALSIRPSGNSEQGYLSAQEDGAVKLMLDQMTGMFGDQCLPEIEPCHC